tara:strand:+ start:273 stop:653 length:381 start_codon:yes stop_codon:yes gene_type:complete
MFRIGKKVLWYANGFVVSTTPFQLNGSLRGRHCRQKLDAWVRSGTSADVTYHDAQSPQVARRLDLDATAPRAGAAHLSDIVGTRVHFQDLSSLDALDERAVFGKITAYVRPDLGTRYREKVTHAIE